MAIIKLNNMAFVKLTSKLIESYEFRRQKRVRSHMESFLW